MKYFCWSLLFSYIGGVPNFLPVFDIEIPILMPYGTYAITIYAIVATYAIVRHRLLDIRVYMTRAGIFALVTVAMIFSALGITALSKTFLEQRIGANWVYTPVMLSMLLAAIGYAFGIYLIRKIDNRWLTKLHQAREALEATGRGLIEIDDINRLARIIPRYLVRFYFAKIGVQIEHATIILYNKEKKKFVLASSAGRQKLVAGKELPQNHPFNTWFTEKRKLLLAARGIRRQDLDVLRYDDILYWMREDRAVKADRMLPLLLKRIEQEMDRLSSVICVPCFYKDELMGLLLLGNKATGIYTQEELNIFYRLATNTAAALKGAQLSSDLRDAQADFIGMEKFATIGRLAASTKHEVNNPLNMVYGSFQHGLRALKNTRDGFSGFRAWLGTTIDKINALSPALAAAGAADFKKKARVLDEAVLALNRESAEHDKFQKELGEYYSHVAGLEKEIETTADKTKNKKEKDDLEELSYLLETVKNIISRVKDRDVLMESILNRGFANARRINTGLDAIYRLPKEVGKGLSPIEVKDIMDASLVFARQQAYWETLTDTLVVKDIPAHLPRIKGYYNRLMSVFSNLFINAYQVMPKKSPLPPGERVIKISARVSPDNPGFVEIRVANRGPLIPRDNLELIFNHGFTTKKGGSGIGLHISKIQVEVFNKGRIYVRNIEDFGPEFVVELPVWKEKEDEKK